MFKKLIVFCLLNLILSLPVSALESGDSIPSFSLPEINGAIFDSESLRGNIVIVDFWATWCPPCRVSLPRLADLAAKYRGRDVKVVLVSVDRSPQTARALLEELGLESSASLIPLIDQNELAARLFHPPTMPTTFIFDRKGRVVLVHHGFKAGDEELFQKEIDSQLNSSNDRATQA